MPRDRFRNREQSRDKSSFRDRDQKGFSGSGDRRSSGSGNQGYSGSGDRRPSNAGGRSFSGSGDRGNRSFGDRRGSGDSGRRSFGGQGQRSFGDRGQRSFGDRRSGGSGDRNPYKAQYGKDHRDFGKFGRFAKSRPEIEAMRKKAFLSTRLGITEKLSSRDALIIQAVNMVDELDKSLNVLSERLREWYSLHFPELSNKVREHKQYMHIAASGERKNIDKPELKELIETSSGANFDEPDYRMMQAYAQQILLLYELRDETAEYLKTLMETEAPNITSIVATNIGARLISLAGGIESMSRMPAGTIQLLGAEKALFRHLKTHSDPPKYGILFQLSEVNSAPNDRRGKVSRAVAAKLAIASKVDFFSKKLEPSIKQKLDKRLQEIRDKE